MPALFLETTEMAVTVVGLQVKLYPKPKNKIVIMMNGTLEDSERKIWRQEETASNKKPIEIKAQAFFLL